jgi:hypothetical protein
VIDDRLHERPRPSYTASVLAYVFWHWPVTGLEPGRYVERLLAFHRVLRAASPAGFRGSRVLAIEGAPWAQGAPAFEDWYFVDDFGALGVLNEAAVTGACQVPHDAVARIAGGGVGGVYRRLADASADVDRVTWCAKPAGVSYAAFLRRLPAAEAWQRQMVLGPTPEFCFFGSAPSGVGAVIVRARVVEDARGPPPRVD